VFLHQSVEAGVTPRWFVFWIAFERLRSGVASFVCGESAHTRKLSPTWHRATRADRLRTGRLFTLSLVDPEIKGFFGFLAMEIENLLKNRGFFQ
jgi:hypothetical protein